MIKTGKDGDNDQAGQLPDDFWPPPTPELSAKLNIETDVLSTFRQGRVEAMSRELQCYAVLQSLTLNLGNVLNEHT